MRQAFFLCFLLLVRLPIERSLQMKIKYQFINESIEIEVSDEWGELLIEFDRQDHNNDRREIRRHTTLDNGYGDGEWLAFDQELDELLSRKETAIHVRAAVDQLKPKQRDLICALYLAGKALSQAEYAALLGITEYSVKQNAWRARTALKRILEKM